MARYEVLKPFGYVSDGKAIVHREVGNIIELEGWVAQKNHGKVRRLDDKGDGDPGTVYDRTEAIRAAQEAEHPDADSDAADTAEDEPAAEAVPHPEASPAEVESASPTLDEKPKRGGRKTKGADGEG